MARIRVDLESVQVIEGQGAGEGNFELRISVQEGSHTILWPGLNSWGTVDNDGPALTINREVATYDIGTAAVTKRFTIDVTEVDRGLNGLDDAGQGTLELSLRPTMTPSSESVEIRLKRPRGDYHGKVKVTLSAQIA